MNILSVTLNEAQNVAVWSDAKQLRAMKECFFSKDSFPSKAIKAIKPVYSDIEYLLCTNKADIKELSDRLNKSVKYIDPRKALINSVKCYNDIDKFSILLEDEQGLYLGYYDKQITWLRKFKKPTLNDFCVSVAKFSGLTDVEECLWSSFSGSDRYTDIIRNEFLKPLEEGFILSNKAVNHNYSLTTDPAITCSSNTVYTEILYNMLSWLVSETKCSTIAILGYPSDNFIALQTLSEHFNFIIVNNSLSACRALGAVAEISPFRLDTPYIGVSYGENFADSIAKKLLQEGISDTAFSFVPFASSYLGNYSTLCIPTPEYYESIKINYNIPRFKPLTVYIQESEYDKYFIGAKTFFHPSYALRKNQNTYHMQHTKVVCVNNSKNSFINRILIALKNKNIDYILGYDREFPGREFV